MFEIKQEFLGIAYGNEIRTARLYWVLKNVFEYITEYYEYIKFDEQALCTDLLNAIHQCHAYANYSLYTIEDELIACVDKEVPLNELRLHVYDTVRYFDDINIKLEHGTYIITE